MDIVIHSHHTDLTETLKSRAQDCVQKLRSRYPRLLSADICFHNDIPKKRKHVEIVVKAPNNTQLFARAAGKRHESALNDALAKLNSQIERLKSARKKKVHTIELRA